ncbi:hypothetical protein CMI42_03665 [Candidatus Pacearchaeota archaeon]|nr:hypothetical protein [Candidatus Pacearchaeota archaeon]
MEKRFLSSEIHSKIKDREKPNSLFAIVSDTVPNDEGLTIKAIGRLREQGYENIWMLLGNANEHGTLYVEGFFKLKDSDFVSEIPYIGARYNGPISEVRGNIRNYDRAVVI